VPVGNVNGLVAIAGLQYIHTAGFRQDQSAQLENDPVVIDY